MSTKNSPETEHLGGLLGRWIGAPTRMQTYRNLLYVLLLFPRGVLYFNVLVVGFATGLGLVVVLVGIPIVAGVLAVATGLAALERTLARVLLDVEVPVDRVPDERGLWGSVKRLVIDLRTWKAVAYLVSVFAFGTAAFGAIASLMATSWSFLTAPLYYEDASVVAYGPIPRGDFTLDILFGWETLLVGLRTTFRLGSWRIETLSGALFVACLGLVLLFFVTLPLVNAIASLWGRYARLMLTVPWYWRRSDG
ncbi:sensor domain-containing protein [Halosolutus gelatinilyticus]|uniref:sensor domain-containing protein n=1 Tax=Halosolutus gelatinilyticus TaxID=2931975 RepID=UPI001FF65D97|nr:sensor domain-containing protein [Halosolutus gelatinilyticus]